MPVLPVDLLDYTQLPSTYIMGIPSSLRSQIDDEVSARLCIMCNRPKDMVQHGKGSIKYGTVVALSLKYRQYQSNSIYVSTGFVWT